MEYHLAQINVALAKDEMKSETMSGFVSRLAEINELAENSDGFVWRLKEESGDATSIRVFDDPLLIINMSVWQNLESLKKYVYQSDHVQLVRNRDSWFHKMKEMYQALWWVPAGHIPTIGEAKERLELIRTNGPTPLAFTFAKNFPTPEPE